MLSAFKDHHRERHAFAQRTLLSLAGVLLLLAIVLVRLGQLQGSEHEYFATRADENRVRVYPVPGVRGLIYDRHGTLLAENLPAYQLEMIPEQVPDVAATLAELQTIIDIPAHELRRFEARRAQSPDFHRIPVKLRLSENEVARFEVNRQRFPGVDVRAGLRRSYPLGDSLAHVIGYVGGITAADLKKVDAEKYRGASYIGKTGIERQYESALHGAPGVQLIEANAIGRRLRELEYQRPRPGEHLYLGIDAELQLQTQDWFEGRRGAAVAIEIGSGEVLALVSVPSFDPALFIDGISHRNYQALLQDPHQPLFNRSVQGQYPPGSTIKPVMALAGLEHGIFGPNHQIFCPGFYTLPENSRRHRDWKRRGHGHMDMHDAVAQSCDVYFYDLAHRLEIDRIHDFLEQFGLGRKLGIDLPSSSSGLLPSRRWKQRAKGQSWFPGETLNIGIGQGFMLATPLQLAVMTAHLASHGRAQRPHLLRHRLDPVTQTSYAMPPDPLPAISLNAPDNWKHIDDAMIAVIHGPRGTAKRIGEGIEYRLAGKTGTAQVAGLSQEDDEAPQLSDVPEHLRDHSLFIGFAPAEQPRVATAVIVEHSGSGSAVAAPIARQMLDLALSRL